MERLRNRDVSLLPAEVSLLARLGSPRRPAGRHELWKRHAHNHQEFHRRTAQGQPLAVRGSGRHFREGVDVGGFRGTLPGGVETARRARTCVELTRGNVYGLSVLARTRAALWTASRH